MTEALVAFGVLVVGAIGVHAADVVRGWRASSRGRRTAWARRRRRRKSGAAARS